MHIYLIGRDSRLYDYHHEGRLWTAGTRRVWTRKTGSASEAVHRGLQRGEGETVEFKPYIWPRSQKEREILETVVAFANTRGGHILIGVNDYCGVEGVEREIQRDVRKRGKTADEGRAEYLGHLRSLISSGVNHSIDVNLELSSYAGHSLVVIEVLEGNEKPYCTLADRKIYVRRGANNVLPDPDTELPALMRGA